MRVFFVMDEKFFHDDKKNLTKTRKDAFSPEREKLFASLAFFATFSCL